MNLSSKTLQKKINDLFFRVVYLFNTIEITEELQEFLFLELSRILQENYKKKRFAIRSSAVGEDSEELSSAGQNETILGCKGEIAILNGIKKCWASLFTYQSVEYRRYVHKF